MIASIADNFPNKQNSRFLIARVCDQKTHKGIARVARGRAQARDYLAAMAAKGDERIAIRCDGR